MQATSVTPEANDRFSVGPCLAHQAVLGTGGKMLLWGTRVMISAAENNRCYRAEVEQVFFKAGPVGRLWSGRVSKAHSRRMSNDFFGRSLDCSSTQTSVPVAPSAKSAMVLPFNRSCVG